MRLTKLLLIAGGVVLAAALWMVWRSASENSSESTPSVAESISPAAKTAEPAAQLSAASSNSQSAGNNGAGAADAHADYRQALASALIERGDATSLAIAALLQESADLAMRASQLAPDDPAVQWLALSACRSIAAKQRPCDVAALERALRTADPDNALHALGELARAQKDGDKAALAAALGEMANKPRFELYNATAEPLIYETILAARVPAPSAPANELTPAEAVGRGVVEALSLPAMGPLVDVCKSIRDGLTPDRCRQIGKTMEMGDSYIVRSVGLNIQEQLAPFGSGRHSEIIDRRRTLDWLAYQITQHPITPRTTTRLMPDAGGEIELWQAWLRENGVPLEPPVDWSRP